MAANKATAAYRPRWAATTTTVTLALLLLGVSTVPSHSFLASCLCRRPGRLSRPRSCGCDALRVVAVASEQLAGSEVNLDRSDERAASSVPRTPRLIDDVKTGDKVIGYVADTTKFAAFVDVGVVRKGSQVRGKVRCMLCHLHAVQYRQEVGVWSATVREL